MADRGCIPERRDAMKFALASYESRVRDMEYNIGQIEKALKSSKHADVVCFGEAFLQGFCAITSCYEEDMRIAVEQDGAIMAQIKQLTLQYGKALTLGYIEKSGRDFYSSYAVIDHGDIIHNYRRITKNWKEYEKTDEHYREGTNSNPFMFRGIELNIALCGNMWICPEKFRTNGILLWPVYVNFDLDDSEAHEYAKQSTIASDNALLVNSLSTNPLSRGGAFHFAHGTVKKQTILGSEDILLVDIA